MLRTPEMLLQFSLEASGGDRGGSAVFKQTLKSEDTMPCAPSAMCDESWAKARSASASMIIIDDSASSGGAYRYSGCTGTLIVSADGQRQYLLAPAYCWPSGDPDLNEVWNFLFNYNSDSCSAATAGQGAFDQAVKGARLVFYDADAGTMLLQLHNPLPAAWGVSPLSFATEVRGGSWPAAVGTVRATTRAGSPVHCSSPTSSFSTANAASGGGGLPSSAAAGPGVLCQPACLPCLLASCQQHPTAPSLPRAHAGGIPAGPRVCAPRWARQRRP
jgi:hypothetical protein